MDDDASGLIRRTFPCRNCGEEFAIFGPTWRCPSCSEGRWAGAPKGGFRSLDFNRDVYRDGIKALYESDEAERLRWKITAGCYGHLLYRARAAQNAWEESQRRAERVDPHVAAGYHARAATQRFVPWERDMDRLEEWHKKHVGGRFDADALEVIRQRIMETHGITSSDVDRMMLDHVADVLERLKLPARQKSSKIPPNPSVDHWNVWVACQKAPQRAVAHELKVNGRRVSQTKISNMKREVDEYVDAGGKLPDWVPRPPAKPRGTRQTMDPQVMADCLDTEGRIRRAPRKR